MAYVVYIASAEGEAGEWGGEWEAGLPGSFLWGV